jgi:NAD(P)-dependent dehydrogenase (short-subunit alcohol dehydrogenase family)
MRFFQLLLFLEQGLHNSPSCLRMQYAKDNIRMNNILPGFIDSLAEKDEFKKHVLLNRYGTTNEISEVVSFLSSDAVA